MGMTRIVAILAHPDDAEILAGGTLYQHRQRGDSVEICSVTYTPDSVRGQEGAAGAQRLGADFTCLGLPDMGVSRYAPEDVERLTAFLLARPPDLVWYIDVSVVWEQKLHALAAHQSQTPAHWAELIRRHNAFYGARCNRQYAEGFRRLSLAFVNNLPAYAYLPS
jgi:LmbE family N-acetylglucosaminyl deacetylase